MSVRPRGYDSRAECLYPEDMTALSIIEFHVALPSNARLLGLDIGDKTVGVAVSDPMGLLATPVETIPARNSPPTPRALPN